MLGQWGIPLSLAVGGLSATLAGYLKSDPASRPSLYQTATGVHTSLENADDGEAGLDTHIPSISLTTRTRVRPLVASTRPRPTSSPGRGGPRGPGTGGRSGAG